MLALEFLFPQRVKRGTKACFTSFPALPPPVPPVRRACVQALADGKNRQILKLSLPLIGATEMDDWPGGDRQRYKACGPMVDTLLRGNPAAKVNFKCNNTKTNTSACI